MGLLPEATVPRTCRSTGRFRSTESATQRRSRRPGRCRTARRSSSRATPARSTPSRPRARTAGPSRREPGSGRGVSDFTERRRSSATPPTSGYDGALYAVDVEAGELTWRTGAREFGGSIAIGSSPAYIDGALYILAEYSNPASGALWRSTPGPGGRPGATTISGDAPSLARDRLRRRPARYRLERRRRLLLGVSITRARLDVSSRRRGRPRRRGWPTERSPSVRRSRERPRLRRCGVRRLLGQALLPARPRGRTRGGRSTPAA